ncbi:MAG: tRNA (guanine(10)-N(2))-dimethyltransferase [Candidatus Micrarchaeia archaeon]
MEVVEGLAKIKIGEGVFYNPKMKRLRDLSVIFLNVAAKQNARILDATAATGIRGIRYLLETPAGSAVLLDINKKAAEAIEQNIKLNGLAGKAQALGLSLQEFANTGKNEAFDVIDLDPFGTPVPYVFDLMKLSKDSTLLMVTATDTATLCGAEGAASIRLYAARALKNELCHESSIRILLGFLARTAAQFDFGIEPLLSIAELHYVRVFVRLKRSAKSAVSCLESIGTASKCNACPSFYYSLGLSPVPQKCSYCGSPTSVFGPLWLSQLYDKQIVGKMLAYAIEEKQESIAETLQKIYYEYDTPFFYSLDKTTEYLRVGSVPIDKTIEMLQSGAKIASRTLFSKNGIKTNAKFEEVVAAVRKIAHS